MRVLSVSKQNLNVEISYLLLLIDHIDNENIMFSLFLHILATSIISFVYNKICARKFLFVSYSKGLQDLPEKIRMPSKVYLICALIVYLIYFPLYMTTAGSFFTKPRVISDCILKLGLQIWWQSSPIDGKTKSI